MATYSPQKPRSSPVSKCLVCCSETFCIKLNFEKVLAWFFWVVHCVKPPRTAECPLLQRSLMLEEGPRPGGLVARAVPLCPQVGLAALAPPHRFTSPSPVLYDVCGQQINDSVWSLQERLRFWRNCWSFTLLGSFSSVPS